MVTVDQKLIKDISSNQVPYVLPICEIHNTLTRVAFTRREALEGERKLRVTRYCRCEECHKDGIPDKPIVNFRVFPRFGTNSD